MTRAADWSPLALVADPVDGDPGMVRTEARYYDDVADRIRDQVTRLRRISDQDGLKGDYSEELRHSCEELAGHLDKAKGRFATTSEQLFALIPHLENAQAETAAALVDAKAAQKADAEDKGDEAEPAIAFGDSEDMTRAKKRLWDAMDVWNGKAKHIADEIRDGSEDDMKDGRFEAVKAWVKEHADMLRKLSEILGAIVLVLAVVIFIVSNPAGWLIGLALLAGAALLIVDSLLAASGEGSWGAVALDVLGLATLGVGSLAGKLARFSRAGSMFKGTRLAGLRNFGSSLASTFNSGGRVSRALRVFKPSTWTTAVREGSAAADDMARGLSKLPVPNAFKASQLSDDLAAITSKIDPAAPLRIHSGTVRVAESMSAVGDRVTVAAAATHSWIDSGGIGTLVNDVTTFEIKTKTW